MPNRAAPNAAAPYHGAPATYCVPALTINDIKSFVLAYLCNEYSPNSDDHGPLSHPVDATYVNGTRNPFTRPGLHYNPMGVTMPPNPARWMAMGHALRRSPFPLTTSATQQAQANTDKNDLRRLLVLARVPIGAIGQIEVVVKDFSRLNRFSRVRTKLAAAGAYKALAARLISDQSLISALWNRPININGFMMPDSPVEVARRNLQKAASDVFSSIRSDTDFQLRSGAVLRRLVTPGPLNNVMALRAIRVNGQILEAYRIAENPDGAVWRHTHREYLAVEDLLDVTRGDHLVREIQFTRECNDCGARHRHDVQLVIGPGDEMPHANELPAHQAVLQNEEQGQEQAVQPATNGSDAALEGEFAVEGRAGPDHDSDYDTDAEMLADYLEAMQRL